MRLIDADALLDVIEHIDWYTVSEKSGKLFRGATTEDDAVIKYYECESAVKEAPTIDAVLVVRCRECKHRFEDSWCEYVDDNDNFYCARGERKEGADNE